MALQGQELVWHVIRADKVVIGRYWFALLEGELTCGCVHHGYHLEVHSPQLVVDVQASVTLVGADREEFDTAARRAELMLGAVGPFGADAILTLPGESLIDTVAAAREVAKPVEKLEPLEGGTFEVVASYHYKPGERYSNGRGCQVSGMTLEDARATFKTFSRDPDYAVDLFQHVNGAQRLIDHAGPATADANRSMNAAYKARYGTAKA